MKPSAVPPLPFFFFSVVFFSLLRAVGGVSTAAGGGGAGEKESGYRSASFLARAGPARSCWCLLLSSLHFAANLLSLRIG